MSRCVIRIKPKYSLLNSKFKVSKAVFGVLCALSLADGQDLREVSWKHKNVEGQSVIGLK
jgi:hypothetical protein